MNSFNLDDTDRFVEVNFTDRQGIVRQIRFDAVEAHNVLIELGERFPKIEQRHEFDAAMRAWIAELGGGTDVPDSYVFLLCGVIRQGFEEFKKKLDPMLRSLMFTESTHSTLDQLKDGRLRPASQVFSQQGNSESERQTAHSSPQTTPQPTASGV